MNLNTIVIKMGDVQLIQDLILKDVLYVPIFYFNIISVHKLYLD